jgi:hypothetical protein
MIFNKNYKTTEFWITILSLCVIESMQFHSGDLFGWAVAVTTIASSYIVGRGIYKKCRYSAIGRGGRTSEFYIALAAVLSIGLRNPLAFGGLSLNQVMVSSSVIVMAYNISRGQAKSGAGTKGSGLVI